MNTQSYIVSFVKYNRTKLQMTQEELAEKAGVGLRFIRELEHGKGTLRIDKVNQVLSLFGCELKPGPSRIADPYDILINHIRRNVRITLKSKIEITGNIIGEVAENGEITGWNFVTTKNAEIFQRTGDKSLIIVLRLQDIETIENI